MNKFILFFLVFNAIFWGLFPHSMHCQVVEMINNTFKSAMKCPPHKVHILMGFIFYVVSVYYTQKDSL